MDTVETLIQALNVSAYTVPTDVPESDGTLAWESTTLVLVEVTAGNLQGLGYTYADTAMAQLIKDTLAEIVLGRDAMAVPGTWAAMVRWLHISGLGATARVPGAKDTWEGWEDSAVPPEKLGVYLRDLRKLLNSYGYACALYGHFGQGCVHTRIDFDLITKEGIITYRSFIHAADLVLSHGGSLSGEHGDGQSRGELLPKMFGPELMQAFREFKRIWDPEWKMNPGKVIDAYQADENLRLGIDYRPPQLPTHFHYPGDDHGSFSHALMRCVGVGECRREHVGTMCPSYRVTIPRPNISDKRTFPSRRRDSRPRPL
jgi:FAD/FMN-containing dehydrogenase